MSNPQDYVVGWICAIHIEYVAAQTFLDDRHEGPESVSTHDNNDYTLGKIGKHNVVIAVLPDGEYGTTSAAGVARDMLHSFPNIRIGLMVGIGGGAPSPKHDVRLGDVVVSAPRNGKSGVFQYDFGKTIQEQSFLTTGSMNQPPNVLRTAVAGIKAQYEVEGHQIEDQISKILGKKRKLQKKYGRPGLGGDRLYLSTVLHPAGDEDTCAEVCGDDSEHLVLRAERDDDEDNPKIHYGQIASANQLMKDAMLRDKLTKEHEVLCFEMEAAGLMNHFPCLVIRGICDYSDTHKNKNWQGYAAMTAAAYAKDLLHRISPNTVEAERRISDVLASVEINLHEVRRDIEDVAIRQKRDQIKNWLSPPDPSTNYNKALQQRQKGTGTWLLQSEEFTQWNTRQNSLLWLYGIPGCGKTILSSTAIQHLDTCSSQPLLYFYFDFNDTRKQNLEDMVASLVSQLYTKSERAQKSLDALFTSCASGRSKRSCQSLCKALTQMIEQAGEVWVVLDALDECRTRAGSETQGLLKWIAAFLNSNQRNVHLLITSRPEQDISSELSEIAPEGKAMVPIQSDLVKDDIETYVNAKVRYGDGLKRWRNRPDVQDEIVSRLITKANGMFRWVSCQIDALERCLEQRSLEKALMCLPETLDETYSRILDSIPGENKQNATRILQLLTYSKRPLSVTELVDAIAVDITKKPHFSPEYRMPDPDEILVYCSSLVIMVPISVNGYDEPVYDEDSDDDENEGSNEKFTDNKNSDDEFIHGANSGDEFTYDEDSDEDSEKYENSDSIYTDGQYSSEENMETMFVLQLAHFSVKEYLTSGRFRGSLSSELNETTARVSIAVVCLSYLLHFDRYLCRRKIVARFPFAKYCAGSWLHYAAAVESESSELTTLLENLFYHNQAAYRVCYRLYSPDVDSRLLWRYDKGTSQPAPALYYAARGNLYTTAKFLLDNGADVNAKGGCRSYALIIASNQGHEGIVQLLIERGADLSVFDDETYNALMEASSIGHTRIAKLLLEHGADVNARGTFGKTALTEATSPWRRWNTQMIRLLLDNGAYDTRSADHMSAVETASWYDHYEALGLLLERGADVYRQNKRFVNEALKTAHLREQKQILKLLLNKGADMYTATCVWRLFYKSVILGHQEMVRTFLEEAYIVLESYVFRPYGTLANFCASFGCTDLLRFIYKNLEKDIYAPELHGKTSLHLVAQSGDMETFEYLISLGADPTVLDAKGDGILCYAAMGGNLEIVNAILNSKLGSEQYSIHWSPLHWACRAGHAEVVELLLEEGLRSHLVATDRLEGQWSPLSIAVYAGKRQMLQSLPATSRSLLGIDNHGPEIRFNPSFGICYGCWLPCPGLSFQCITCRDSCLSSDCSEFEESDSRHTYLYCFMCKPFLSHLHKDHEWSVTSVLLTQPLQ